jgi:hypothetical protein
VGFAGAGAVTAGFGVAGAGCGVDCAKTAVARDREIPATSVANKSLIACLQLTEGRSYRLSPEYVLNDTSVGLKMIKIACTHVWAHPHAERGSLTVSLPPSFRCGVCAFAETARRIAVPCNGGSDGQTNRDGPQRRYPAQFRCK